MVAFFVHVSPETGISVDDAGIGFRVELAEEAGDVIHDIYVNSFNFGILFFRGSRYGLRGSDMPGASGYA